ncbi:DUF3618 domain-containing protein [Pseudonocardia oroxyli]|uniref:DUF3618 domain-containing protein n=1 Tax=Pseudonocardia oroxyli TaxID=366584 RepID=A0A1G7WL56_PSEOR|nr:DUF3618 domain-containing protein [Pseudonocardia oroxyli]SDG72598.1 Protein of unknown function [Pseudonocardia oroxyli]
MSSDPDELRAKIAEEREALGETAAALAARADVVGRVENTVHDTAESVRTNATQILARARSGEDRRPLFALGAVLGALVVVVVVRAFR